MKATHVTTGIERAAKKIPKNALEDQKLFENEVECLMELDHPHIVKLVEYFDDEEQHEYILVFEMCNGPDLFDRIVDVITDKHRFDEVEAGRLLRHMLKAVLCCHSHYIIHRDIKPENFMFSRPDPRSSLKMIDLGLSQHYSVADPKKIANPEKFGAEPDDTVEASATPIGTIAYEEGGPFELSSSSSPRLIYLIFRRDSSSAGVGGTESGHFFDTSCELTL